MDKKSTCEELEQRIKELEGEIDKHKAETSLKLYERIVDSSSNHMSFLDKNYIYRAVNNAYLAAHKKSREAIVGHSVIDLMGKKVFDDLIKEKIDRCLAGELIRYESWFNFPGSGKRFMDVVYHPYFENSESVSGIIVVSHDITRRKIAEKALAEKTTMLDNILNNAQDIAIITTDLDFRINYYNPIAEKLFGYTAEKVLGKTVQEIHTKEKVDPGQLERVVESVCSKGKYCYSVTKETEDGPRYLESRVSGIFDPDGKMVGFSLFCHDVTKRKQAEEALRESEEKFSKVADYSYDWEYWVNPKGEFIYVSPSCKRITGYSANEFLQNPGLFLTIVNSDDVKLVKNHKHKARETGKVDPIEFRIITKTGEERWIGHTCQTVYDNNGLNLGQRGCNRDITKRKHAEEVLRENEERFRMLFDQAGDAVFVHNIEGQIVEVNEKACSNLGYSRDELMTMSVFDIEVRLAPEALHELWKGIKPGGTITVIGNQQRKNGSTSPVEVRLGLIRRKGQKLMIVIVRDISERKQAEAALRQRERYLTGLNEAMQVLLVPTDTVPFQEFVDKIGPASGASRTYVFINHQDKDGSLLMSQKAEWCAEGISSETDNPKLHCLSYDVLSSGCKDTLEHGDIISGLVSGLPAMERKILDPQGILAILIIPIMVDGKFIGFIGFDNCVSGCELNTVVQTFLRIAANDLAQAIKRAQAEELVRASLKEKEVLLREIHHRVKNNMQVIVSLLRMHSRSIDDARLVHIFDDCRCRVNAMSLIHEALYQSKNMDRIDFEVYLKKLCRNLSQAYNASGRGITIKVQQCNVALGMDQGIAVGMVISELISNSFKHAFPSGKEGNVLLSLSCIDGKEIELIVQDNGKGLPPEIDILNTRSLGLRLTTAAITRELDGSIEVERNGGTRFIIHFKSKSK